MLSCSLNHRVVVANKFQESTMRLTKIIALIKVLQNQLLTISSISRFSKHEHRNAGIESSSALSACNAHLLITWLALKKLGPFLTGARHDVRLKQHTG